MAKKKNNRLKLSKRLLSMFLAMTIVGGIGVGTVQLAKKMSLSKDDPTKLENQIGHSDCGLIVDWSVDDEDFIIFDIGDHNRVETHFQDHKMTKCNEHDISFGVIISSDAENEADIYDDVEYAKSVVAKYDVDFPVYLNIDEIITNDDLNLEMKTKLIKNFLEKCTSNGMYVGVSGTDTNLVRMKEYCKITGYDAYVMMDEDTIKYDGAYNVYKDLNGNIQSRTNIAEITSTKKLNEKSGFANDGSYTFKEGDELTDIALQYGLSVNELLKFNSLSKDKVTPGVKLRIPSIIDTIIPTEVGDFKTLETPIRGADISYAQGTNINWDKMADNFEFLILRCSQGTDLDETFEENAKNCNLHDIPMGVYCYNAYTKNNTEDMDDFVKKQTKQADFVLDSLKNKKVEYPVYFDLEAPNGVNLSSILTKEQVASMLEVWCTKMQQSGYIPGLYCNQSTFKYIQSCVDYKVADELQVWIAGGDQYYGETRDIDINDVVPSNVLDKDYGATMAQSTDSAINSGAGNHLGHIDVNFSTVDYTDQDIVYENDLYDIKEFERTDGELLEMFGGGATAGIAILAAGAIIGKKKKQKGTRNSYRPQQK